MIRILPLALLLGPLPAGAAERLVVPLRILLARCPDASGALAPVHPGAWLDEHVRGAARVLSPHQVELRPTVEEFTPAQCDLEDRAGRDALADVVRRDGQVTVVVVRRVQDLAVPGYDLMGVDWAARGRQRRWIFLTARARPPVLAHELGHYFGLPHDRRGGNLMTPGPSDPAWRRRHKPRPMRELLTPAQARRLRHGVRAFLGQALTAPPGSAARAPASAPARRPLPHDRENSGT